MVRRFVIAAACAAACGTGFAGGFTWVKSIDCATVVNDAAAQLKDIAVDASGNLYLTTYFATGGNNYVFKVADPMVAATVTQHTADAYPTSNGAGIAFDKDGKFYITSDDAGTPFIRRYNADGTLDTTWGTAGVLTPVAVGGTVRPRQITYSGAADHKLIASLFGTPYRLCTFDCATGAGSAAGASTYGDVNDNGGYGNDVFSGLAYDSASKTVYGNCQADLATVSGADLADLSTFVTTGILTRHGRVNVSNQGVAYDSASGLIAYTMWRNSKTNPPFSQQIGVYNLATGYEIPVGAQALGQTGYIDSSAGVTWLRNGGNLYLVAESSRDKVLQIFRYDAPFPTRAWTHVKSVSVSSMLPVGSRIKDVAADSLGNLFFTAYFQPAYIYKVADALNASPVLSQFSSDATYPSTSGNNLTVDNSNNVYLCSQGADAASSYIKKYDSSGALVPGFGTGGILSPVTCGGAGVRPRSIAWTGASTNKLFVCTFGTPYTMGVIDAITGADGGPTTSTLGDNDDNGVVAENQVFQAAAYDAANNAIYGNSMCDLIKMTGSGATLSDLNGYNQVTAASLRRYPMSGGLDNINVRIDPTGRWLAYTAFQDWRTGGPTTKPTYVAVRELGDGSEELVGGYAGQPDVVDVGGAPTFFKVGATQYLAVTSYYGNSIQVFSHNGSPAASVGEWSLY